MKEQTVEGKMQAGGICLNGYIELYWNTNRKDAEFTTINWHGIKNKIFLVNKSFSVNLSSKILIILKFYSWS